MKRGIFLIAIMLSAGLLGFTLLNNSGDDQKLSGKYLGQTPPGEEPEIFAPGFISTGLYTRDFAMMPDGNEVYFCVSSFGYNLIYFSKQVNGYWTEPVPAPFIRDFQYMYYEPHITYDGKKLLFLSVMPDKDGVAGDQDIWAVDRAGEGWGEPYNLGEPVNSDDEEYYPSTSKDGTIYFTRQTKGSRAGNIYRCRMVDGKYAPAELLNENVNCGTNRYNAFISPDEDYIIVPAEGMPDTKGGTDYYIVFRDKNDNWSKPVNLGDKINTQRSGEFSASLSPDGKYFFFMSARLRTDLDESKLSVKYFVNLMTKPQNGNPSIYWVSSNFIDDLRPEEFK